MFSDCGFSPLSIILSVLPPTFFTVIALDEGVLFVEEKLWI